MLNLSITLPVYIVGNNQCFIENITTEDLLPEDTVFIFLDLLDQLPIIQNFYLLKYCNLKVVSYSLNITYLNCDILNPPVCCLIVQNIIRILLLFLMFFHFAAAEFLSLEKFVVSIRLGTVAVRIFPMMLCDYPLLT